VAAGEDQLEPLVRDGHLLVPVLDRQRALEQGQLGLQRAVTPDAVDGTVTRGGDEPRGRVGGSPFARPALGGDREGLLGGFLGELEVAEEADKRSEDTAPLLPEDLLYQR
jgi:hypothetical protein